MIYICGSNINRDNLPLLTDLTYTFEEEENRIKLVLSMGIRKPSVTRAYVAKTYESMTVADPSKVVYFADEAELIDLLKPQSDVSEPEVEPDKTSPATMEEVTDNDIEDIQNQVDADREANKVAEEPASAQSDSDDLEEIETGITMPTVTGDSLSEVDLLRTKLSTMEGVVTQSRSCMEQSLKERDEVYDYAMEQTSKMQKEYEEKLKEAQSAIDELKAQLDKSESAPSGPLSGYEPYVAKCRAVIKTAIQGTPELQNVIAVSVGSADTTSTLYQSLSLLALSGADVTILDFTGDPVFGITVTNTAVKMKNLKILANGEQRTLTQEEYAQCTLDQSKDLVNYIRGTCSLADTLSTHLAQSKIAVAGYYHDLSLLAFDWQKCLSDIKSIQNNSKVIILLPPITSFVGRYLVSYLSSAVTCNVAAICAPSSLYSVQTNCNAIPARRVRLLALNYVKIPATDGLLQGVLNDKYPVRMFRANNFFSNPEATQDDLQSNIENNNKIWITAFNPLS